MKPCVCGHDRILHDHHRAGTDCAKRGCSCPRYRRRRWWRRTPDAPAAVRSDQAIPPWPGPPPGPLPRHDTGPIAAWTARTQCGCFWVFDGAWHVTDAKGCRIVAHLRRWDAEMRQWELEHPL